MKRLTQHSLSVLCLLSAMALAGLSCAPENSRPREEIVARGLREQVEILRDSWGVSHIYARNQHDLFFAQGYNAARDRLFQLEMWRRMATGTLSEAFGERFLAQDLGSRLLRLRADMKREMAHYHPDGEEIITAFVKGVNAYVKEALEQPENLPMEFGLLGIEPGLWTPEVVVSRHNGLFRNADAELSLALAVNKMGSAAVKEFYHFEPPDPDLEPAPGLDLDGLSEQILQVYQASRQRPVFLPEDVVDEQARAQDQAAAGALRQPSAARRGLSPLEAPEPGSNNWVVAPARSATGAAFMANDPHRSLQAPSLRYFVHLTAPGWDVIGGGEPALPGVSIGHNQEGAWGLTIFSVDQEDLYVYRTNPQDPLQYRYREQWEKMRVEEETIPVKGRQPQTVQLKFTRHGPVIYQDQEAGLAYALKAAWLEVGGAPYLASLRINQALTWEEFRQACSYFLTPSENMVWADRQGNIGWQATGITPRRPNWSGLLPVPGDGRYEWDGYVPVLDLPHAYNPPSGYLATANENNLPQNYRPVVGFRWAEPYRKQRLDEFLSREEKLTLEQMRELQLDYLSIPARQLTPLLLAAAQNPPQGAKRDVANWEAALKALDQWDYRMQADSMAAAVYTVFERYLRAGLARLLYPQAIGELGPPRLTQVLRWMRTPHPRLGRDPQRARDALLLSSLGQALEELQERLGEDASRWRYGSADLHHVRIVHPLSQALRPDLAARLDHGPLPRGGNRHSVNMTTSRDNQSSGATFRVIADLSDWDSSLATNSPGQSGDPSSPHYRDLFQPWADGRYFPLLYSPQAVVDGVATRLRLKPAGPGSE
ncbi:MAG TPA: penicillin acylase family protein [Acidobacteriota bacterium]|nr:penicillin acylase family protein [Acidobacteriota bacterium]